MVPSRQRAHAVRVAHAAAQLAQGLRVWPSADVLPLEGWLTREIERCAASGAAADRLPRLLTAAEEWLLWRECTAEAAGHLELVNGAALAQDLRAAHRLALEVQLDLRALRAAPGTETALFLEVHHAVEARSRALGAASAASLLSRIPALGDAPLLLGGYPSPSPLLRSLTEARRARGLETQWARLEPVSGPPRVLMPADELEELDHIAGWCRRRLAAHPEDRLLVVLPGPAGRRERLAALIRQALDPRGAYAPAEESGALVSLEGGGALSGQPAVAHALESLALLCGEAVPLDRLAPWLLAPFWSEPPLEGRARLELWLRERAGLSLDRPALRAALHAAPGPFEAAARSCAAQLDRAESTLRHASGSPREWSERFRGALRELGWPGAGAQSSLEQQTQLRFHELLDEFGQLSAALGTLSRAAALERLGELAAQTSYRPADEDAVITLTASLADPVVRYEGIWVAGLHAEAFPQPLAPDPFVPLAAQLAAGSPGASAAGRLAEAHSLLAAWRAAAGELVLSMPRRSEDLDLLPSPLLAPWAEGGAAQESGKDEPLWLALRAHRADQCESWEDAGLPWDTREPLPAGTRSIELQNLCPFRAYAELRLGGTELTEREPGVAPDFRGRLLHAALQRLWSVLRDSRSLGRLAPAELDERIAESVSGAIEELSSAEDAPPPAPALARERRRTERLMRQLLDLERQRNAFTVRHTEYASHIDLGGIRLRVRMDRIDALDEGGLAILDYKSGRPVSVDWYGERPSHPQLLTYLTAFGAEVIALATVNVTAREVRFQGIAAGPNLLPRVLGVKGPEGAEAPWPARVREWGDVVRRLARDFAAGVATVDPKPGACDYCPVSSVCRIGDAPTRDAGEALTGEGE